MKQAPISGSTESGACGIRVPSASRTRAVRRPHACAGAETRVRRPPEYAQLLRKRQAKQGLSARFSAYSFKKRGRSRPIWRLLKNSRVSRKGRITTFCLKSHETRIKKTFPPPVPRGAFPRKTGFSPSQEEAYAKLFQLLRPALTAGMR